MTGGMGEVDRSLEEALVQRRNGYDYVIHPLTDGVPRVSPLLLSGWAQWAAAQRDLLDGATLLLAPEAMGPPLAAALSLSVGVPYGILRKRPYNLPGEATAASKTGYGHATLHVNDVRPGDRVVVVDDVLSTGGTLQGILATLQAMGAQVQGVLVFLEKGTCRRELQERFGVPIRCMRTVRVEGGKVILA